MFLKYLQKLYKSDNTKLVKLNFEEFTTDEKVDLASIWQGYGNVSKKLEEVILTRILLEKAETPEQIKFAREIIGMQNDFMRMCYLAVESESSLTA